MKIISVKNGYGLKISRFAKKYYGSQKNFANEISMSPQQLNMYVKNGRKPNLDILTKFHYAGMSIDWLISESRSMTAKNEAGIKLNNKFERNDDLKSEKKEESNVSGVSDSKTVMIPYFKSNNELKMLVKDAIYEIIEERKEEEF